MKKKKRAKRSKALKTGRKSIITKNAPHSKRRSDERKKKKKSSESGRLCLEVAFLRYEIYIELYVPRFS